MNNLTRVVMVMILSTFAGCDPYNFYLASSGIVVFGTVRYGASQITIIGYGVSVT